MTVKNLQRSETLSFRKSIQANLTSVQSKRNITVIVVCFSNQNAVITIGVATNNGQVSKQLLLSYNTNLLFLGWEVFYDNKKYMLNSLTQLGTIVNGMVVSLNNLKTKV
jgi:hypothetical protein